MWYSFSDKWDIVKHVDEKKPRSFKSNIWGLVILLVVFLFHVSPLEAKLNASLTDAQYNLVYLLLFMIAAFALAALFLLKYIRNKGEIDLWLILCIAIAIVFLII